MNSSRNEDFERGLKMVKQFADRSYLPPTRLRGMVKYGMFDLTIAKLPKNVLPKNLKKTH
jgi:hypothetical protein